jgi:tetratricopeptide (TPR) repeat protein
MRKSFNIPHAVPICLVLIITTLAVFWQVKDHEFINFDDPLYVTENLHIQGGITLKGVTWAFTTFHAGNWHPLTWLSHMLDVQFFGLKAGWHHLMNLLFHIASTLLLFLVLHRMTKALWQSAFVAALFALHPLHVESVAWVSERKDVLSTFFWMLTMGAYVFYVEKPEIKRYVLTLFFFALGLMAKPMLVTLPFVLLLLDYWPLKRLQYGTADPKNPAEALPPSAPVQQKRKSKKQQTVKEKVQAKKPTDSPYQWTLIRPLVWEKIPFFILTVLSSAVTYVAQWKGGAMKPLEAIAFDGRIANALVSYVAYIAKMIWPANLAFLYPHPGMVPHWQILGAVLFLALSTFLILRMVRRVPYLTVGWLWYLGTLVPVIGIVQVGLQGMADRYTYVPSIGLFIMIAWAIPQLLAKWPYRTFTFALAAMITFSALIYTTWINLRYWQNSVLLFQQVLVGKEDNATFHYLMGNFLSERGRYEEAIYHYTKSLQINNRNPGVHCSWGNILFNQGKIDEAIGHYKEALRIDPNNMRATWDLGDALLRQGKREEAAVQYTRVLQRDPEDAEAHLNLGNIRASQGKPNEAMTHFREAIRLKDDNVKAITGLGNVLVMQGNFAEAMAWYSKAVKIAPADAEVHYDMGTIMASQGKLDEATAYFREAIRITPDYAKAHNNLGSALLLQGKRQEAIEHFREAVRIQPDYTMAQENIRKAMALQRKAR